MTGCRLFSRQSSRRSRRRMDSSSSGLEPPPPVLRSSDVADYLTESGRNIQGGLRFQSPSRVAPPDLLPAISRFIPLELSNRVLDPVFSSYTQGLSPTLLRSCLTGSLDGAHILLVRTTTVIMGAFLTSRWLLSSRHVGSNSSFVFTRPLSSHFQRVVSEDVDDTLDGTLGVGVLQSITEVSIQRGSQKPSPRVIYEDQEDITGYQQDQMDTTEPGSVTVFQSSGINRYYQSVHDNYLSVGGGDGFALRLSPDLRQVSSSAHCDTFNCPSLLGGSPTNQGIIREDVLGIEVWCFFGHSHQTSCMSEEPLSLDILRIAHQFRVNNGLRRSDYTRYQRYLTTRLARIRFLLSGKKREHLSHYAMKKQTKRKGKGPSPVIPPLLEASSITSAKQLEVCMLLSERAMAHAFRLRQAFDSETTAPEVSGRLHRHYVQRLRRAACLAQRLAQAAREQGDTETAVEAEAYAHTLRGSAAFEAEHWPVSVHELCVAQNVLKELESRERPADPGELGDHAKYFLDSIDPLARYAFYRLGEGAEDRDQVARERAALERQARSDAQDVTQLLQAKDISDMSIDATISVPQELADAFSEARDAVTRLEASLVPVQPGVGQLSFSIMGPGDNFQELLTDAQLKTRVAAEKAFSRHASSASATRRAQLSAQCHVACAMKWKVQRIGLTAKIATLTGGAITEKTPFSKVRDISAWAYAYAVAESQRFVQRPSSQLANQLLGPVVPELTEISVPLACIFIICVYNLACPTARGDIAGPLEFVSKQSSVRLNKELLPNAEEFVESIDLVLRPVPRRPILLDAAGAFAERQERSRPSGVLGRLFGRR